MLLAKSRISRLVNAEERIGISIDDCARLCLDKIGAECRTFSFCYIKGDCVFTSDSYIDEVFENGLVNDNYCDVYQSSFEI